MALNADTQYYLRVRHEGNSLGWSEYGGGIYSFRTPDVIVNPPSIISPTAGSSVVKQSITISISSPTASGGTINHSMTDYKLVNSSGTTIDSSLNNSSNLLSTTLNASSTSLTSATVMVRVYCSNYGWSEWSSLSINLISGISSNGRLLYLNDTNDGIVIEHNLSIDGSTERFVVGLASSRAVKQFGGFGLSMSNALPVYSLQNNSNSNSNIFGNGSAYSSSGNSVGIYSPATDSQLKSLWSTIMDVNSAKYNCDKFLEYNTFVGDGVVGFPAINYTRSITIGGSPCDVPNIRQLMVILALAETIDSLDPTASQYPNYKLYFNDGSKINCVSDYLYTNDYTSCIFSSTISSAYSNISCWRDLDLTSAEARVQSSEQGLLIVPITEL